MSTKTIYMCIIVENHRINTCLTNLRISSYEIKNVYPLSDYITYISKISGIKRNRTVPLY